MSEFPQVQGPRAMDKARRPWTDIEDQTLRHLVSQFGSARGRQGRWTDIARGFPDRTAKECRKRWFHSLDPSVRKGPWTQQEDRILLEGFARLGPAWSDICLLIPGRKDDQCSKRYNDILAPSAKDRLRGWSEEEDQVLRDSVQSLGHRWSAISALFPGRPPLTCRNRWRHLSAKQTTISSGEDSGSPSISPDTPQEPIQDHDSMLSNSHTSLAYSPGPTPIHDLYSHQSTSVSQLGAFQQIEDIDSQPSFLGETVPATEMAFDAMDFAFTEMLSAELEPSHHTQSQSTTAWDTTIEFDTKTNAASSPTTSIGIASSLLSRCGPQYAQSGISVIGEDNISSRQHSNLDYSALELEIERRQSTQFNPQTANQRDGVTNSGPVQWQTNPYNNAFATLGSTSPVTYHHHHHHHHHHYHHHHHHHYHHYQKDNRGPQPPYGMPQRLWEVEKQKPNYESSPSSLPSPLSSLARDT